MLTLKPYLLLSALVPISMMNSYATPDIDYSSDYVLSVEETQQLLQDAIYIKQALAYQNYAAIAPLIHPTRGVRFSMYAYVDPKTDKVFSRTQFEQYLKTTKIKFTWGEQDGTGDLYITTLPTYLHTWVNGQNYSAIAPTFNQFQGFGNSLNNLLDSYSNADFVEFYYPGTEQYSGMDWRALRLVFDGYGGKRYLVAIINDQWTI